MYVIILSYLVDLSAMDKARPEHLKWLQGYYDQGLFIASGRQASATGGVIISKWMPRKKLDEILATDPFSVAGLTEYQIIEFDPKMTCPELVGVIQENN